MQAVLHKVEKRALGAPCAVLRRCFAAMVLSMFGAAAQAHPHVFIDGGVNFSIRDEHLLNAVDVTWIYDAFETLYILSSYEISLNAEGGLSEADRLEVVRRRSDWPADFDGSVHLSSQGKGVGLEWPSRLDADVHNGRLHVTFTRVLETPLDLKAAPLEVGFFESTYFFAFSITQAPALLGDAGACSAEVIPHTPNADDSALQATLRKLSREETPEAQNVGALFADRIVLQCA